MGFFDIVNIRGLIFAVLLALPHALYIRSSFYKKPVHENRAMVYISRIGRFFSFFLMSVNIGVLERGFTSALMESFWFWFCVWVWFWVHTDNLCLLIGDFRLLICKVIIDVIGLISTIFLYCAVALYNAILNMRVVSDVYIIQND